MGQKERKVRWAGWAVINGCYGMLDEHGRMYVLPNGPEDLKPCDKGSEEEATE
jgi:hypothetical protein